MLKDLRVVAFCFLVFRELLFTAHLEQGELHLEHLVGALVLFGDEGNYFDLG